MMLIIFTVYCIYRVLVVGFVPFFFCDMVSSQIARTSTNSIGYPAKAKMNGKKLPVFMFLQEFESELKALSSCSTKFIESLESYQSVMTDMKGMSWVGDIYQKFEAMCLEMEDAMYQDTARYVQNQVQTVGASVKRFYSDVMLDLHPQFDVDPVKVTAADLSLNPYAHTEISKKLKANLKRGHPRGINKELIDDTQVIKGKSKSGGVYRRQSVGIKEIVRDNHPPSKKSAAFCLVSGDAIKLSSDSKVRGGFEVASDHMTTISPLASVKEPDSAEAGKEFSDHIINTNVPAVGISINAAACDTSLSVDCFGKNQVYLGNISSVGDLQADSSDRGTHKELAGETGLKIDNYTHDINIASEEINDSCKERSDRFCSPTPDKYDLIESDLEIVEHYDETKLEETCVLVEVDRLYVPQDSVKQKSYKKKLRQVFSKKKKSTSKEYEKLLTLHGDQQPNLEVEEKAMQVLAKTSNVKNLSSANDHSESEWEFL